jgi:hypothetical protein
MSYGGILAIIFVGTIASILQVLLLAFSLTFCGHCCWKILVTFLKHFAGISISIFGGIFP